MLCLDLVFFYKQKTAYEMRISDWSSDVCSSDLPVFERKFQRGAIGELTALFTKQFFPGRMAFGHRRRRFDSTPRDLRRIDQRVARPRVQIDANHVAGAQP